MAELTVQEQIEGHKALLELESCFNAKPRGAVLSIQGSQINALAMFSKIFQKYSYPVIINAAVLKLADWFRLSNNVVKFHVYQVFKQASDLHLAKVLNVEETVRRILSVLDSNDPVARSITLRILGCMSMIISEKLDVHFGLLQRLEQATDRIEVEAVIWAVDRICARSERFPAVVYSKLTNELQDPSTSPLIKLKLVRIFRHMHRNIGMARQAKQMCLYLLEKYKTDEKFVIETLRTLTLLLSEARIDLKEQVGIGSMYGLYVSILFFLLD
ncbi:hypothetical protein BDF14DRAFT_1721510 [Spinellus fusiger]|nr:hypothetical protein BDF14DRAFT_1721510 [Spinellus fusiger]